METTLPTRTATEWNTIQISTTGGQCVEALLTDDPQRADALFNRLIRRWYGEGERVERTATLIGPDGETVAEVTVPAKGPGATI